MLGPWYASPAMLPLMMRMSPLSPNLSPKPDDDKDDDDSSDCSLMMLTRRREKKERKGSIGRILKVRKGIEIGFRLKDLLEDLDGKTGMERSRCSG